MPGVVAREENLRAASRLPGLGDDNPGGVNERQARRQAEVSEGNPFAGADGYDLGGIRGCDTREIDRPAERPPAGVVVARVDSNDITAGRHSRDLIESAR